MMLSVVKLIMYSFYVNLRWMKIYFNLSSTKKKKNSEWLKTIHIYFWYIYFIYILKQNQTKKVIEYYYNRKYFIYSIWKSSYTILKYNK